MSVWSPGEVGAMTQRLKKMGRDFRKMIIKWIAKLVLGILYLGNFINTVLIKSYTFEPGEDSHANLGWCFCSPFLGFQ